MYTPSSSEKALGYEAAARELYPDQEPCILQLEDDSDEWQSSYDLTLRLMREHPETDSIIYATDLMANAGVLALKKTGRRIPEQVAVIGVDNSIYSRICSPTLTSLDNKMKSLSITCSQILVNVLKGEKIANKMMVFSSIVEREST